MAALRAAFTSKIGLITVLLLFNKVSRSIYSSDFCPGIILQGYKGEPYLLLGAGSLGTAPTDGPGGRGGGAVPEQAVPPHRREDEGEEDGAAPALWQLRGLLATHAQGQSQLGQKGEG